MYQIDNYVDTNSRGTALLLEAALWAEHRPQKIILSSSRAVYGEGRLRCTRCGVEFNPPLRSAAHLAQQIWEHPCPNCRAASRPLATIESAPLQPTTIYGMTKLEQEHLCQVVSQAYGIPVTILRYFNVYGPGQSPSNPYTGILSIFSRRLMSGQGIEVYEDGAQIRDFVYVDDVVQANLLAAQHDVAGAFNICSGEALSVYDVAESLCATMNVPKDVLSITGKYRVGDIRHCYGSWQLAHQALGFRPRTPLNDGLEQLVAWLREQTPGAADEDSDQKVKLELESHGLFR